MTMKVVAELWLCGDCTMAACYDDYSGSLARVKAIRRGIRRLGAIRFAGNEPEFKHAGCDCCQDGLAGDKTEFVILGEE